MLGFVGIKISQVPKVWLVENSNYVTTHSKKNSYFLFGFLKFENYISILKSNLTINKNNMRSIFLWSLQ